MTDKEILEVNDCELDAVSGGVSLTAYDLGKLYSCKDEETARAFLLKFRIRPGSEAYTNYMIMWETYH